MMRYLVWALFLLASVGVARAQDVTATANTRHAIERALPFLEKDGIAWMNDKGCVSCHHVPFMLWTHNQARARGIAINETKLAEWTDWSWKFSKTRRAWFKLTDESLNQDGAAGAGNALPADVLSRLKDAAVIGKPFTTEAELRAQLQQALTPEQFDQHNAALVKRATRPLEPDNDGGGLDTLAQLLLGRAKDAHAASASDLVADLQHLVVRWQQADGSWKAAGQLPSQNRPEPETHAVTTLWALLALASIEPRDAATDNAIHRGLEFVKTVKPGASSESLLTALLVARQFGDADRADKLLAELLTRQNEDGGWSWRQGGDSDAFATGQALYALADCGSSNSCGAAIERARAYLTKSQTDDGAWSVPSRAISRATAEPRLKRLTPIYRYWGTAWAVIGLAQTLPATNTAQSRSPASAPATAPTTAPAPPRQWVDPDTGHTVHRLTDEPNSTGLYFNMNAFTPDGNQMVYSAPDGIHVLDLASRHARLLVPAKAPGQLKTIMVGFKTPTLYFVNNDEKALYAADITTGQSRELAALPPRGSISTVNADETLAAGTYIEGTAGEDYGQNRVNPPGMSGPLVQPLNKGQMMEQRLAARLPMVLFTIDLKTGEKRELLHSTDWLNHLLFSPADPSLLMYCHEGPWHKVDRIWTIRTDGSQNQLIHKRTMAMEIAGHEFWGADGKNIFYDLQTPRGQDFWLAAYNVATRQHRAYHLQRDEWSIHFNVTADETLFCGDGGDAGQVAHAADGKWIYLFRPQLGRIDGQSPQGNETLIQPGVLQPERLVNMDKHNYKLEPNVRFSPDHKMVLFTSNLLGPSYVFGVEVEKAGTTRGD